VNSGGPPLGTFETVDEGAWARAIDGTLLSTIRLIRAGLEPLRQAPDAAILIILSSSVREPVQGIVTSNVLRPGLAGLIKSLVTEIAPIRINGIAPGRVSTDRIAQLDRARAAATGRSIDEIQSEAMAGHSIGCARPRRD
jgi:3-oxoacyl-[acyl-carrier protein] reductase